MSISLSFFTFIFLDVFEYVKIYWKIELCYLNWNYFLVYSIL